MMLDKMNNVFFEEAGELLESLEGNLLSLEEDPENKDIISAVFRAMHTIKGSAGMFGFDAVSKFTHEVETTYDLVRNGSVPVTHELIDLTLRARDHINDLLHNADSKELDEISKVLISEFKKISMGTKAEEAEPQPTSKEVDSSPVTVQSEQTSDSIDKTWRISFKPPETVFCNGTRPLLLVNELVNLGTATVVPLLDNVPALSEIESEKCYLQWDIILTTTHSKEEIEDVFIFVDGPDVVKLEPINIDVNDNKKIGEILIERKVLTEEDLNNLVNKQKRLGQLLVDSHLVSEHQVASALAEQSHLKMVSAQHAPEEQKTGTSPAAQSIRVSSEKLDQLIDLVGELVTFNARLGQCAQELKMPALITLSEQSERLILSLRDTSMDMRMLPIGTIFSRFRRLVHDLASSMNKKIELITEGAETELDKTVIEKLNDPLVHLIRNSADHGIESPAVRQAAGKNPVGAVTLAAKHAGAFVMITVSDDGAGLDKDKILSKAIERGLVQPGTDIADSEIYDLIFQPGFSTSDKVTAVSGRGVGMDVVKKDIASLGGTVAIETKQGGGTNFILKIPLTLAIIEGMLVQIGANSYVIPLTNIQECLEFHPETDAEGKTCSHINARGQLLPYINLRSWFEIEGDPPASQQVVVVNDQDSSLGIVVDRVIGNHQTVIKPLGKLYKNIKGLSGSTVLGDGSVALILDIFKLSEVVRKAE